MTFCYIIMYYLLIIFKTQNKGTVINHIVVSRHFLTSVYWTDNDHSLKVADIVRHDLLSLSVFRSTFYLGKGLSKKIKSNISLGKKGLEKDLQREIISFFVKISFCRISSQTMKPKSGTKPKYPYEAKAILLKKPRS